MTLRWWRHLAELLEDAADYAKSEEDWLASRAFQVAARYCRDAWSSHARTAAR